VKYRTVVADPPWEYHEGFAQGPTGDVGHLQVELGYPSMSLEELADLPVSRLAHRDALLFLWTTNRYLPDAFPLMGLWGFAYRQLLVWHKTNATPLGGAVAPNSAEYLLVGRRGNVRLRGRWHESVIAGPNSEHSRKPEVFLDVAETISRPPYLELFARRQRLGWDTWGNEALEHVSLTGGRNHGG
jgi:N6-adenosine-specific RNA methylase IME4